MNQFIKGASGCSCTGDGVFFIKITGGVPTLSNILGADLGFKTSSFLKRFIKKMGVSVDGVYGFRSIGNNVMFENIQTCPNVFIGNNDAKEFVYNTNNCQHLTDGFYGISVSGCNASYLKVLNDSACSLGSITGLTNNSYTCGSLVLSWNDVPGSSQYSITDGTTTRTSTISMVTIPFTVSGNKTYTVTPVGIAGYGTSDSITVNRQPCAITGLTTNGYIHGNLTLSWDASVATYYRVTYGSTTTDVTVPTITIPYTVGGNVTYQVSACNTGGCSVPTTITVPMMQSGVSGISSGSYSCGDLTLTWTPTAGATQYWVSYGITNTYVTSPTITIPYTSPGSVTYTVRAGNSNGYNTGSTISVTMNSCGISNLTPSGYTCGDLNLNWDDTFGATSYKVSYLTNEIITTTSNTTIPFGPTTGNVTYTVAAYNGTSIITSASITVYMQQCVTYLGNTYSSDGAMKLTTDNNPTNFFGNTTLIDDRTQTGEIVGFSGSFNPTWIKQNPYTKKIHYGTSSGVYVGNVGEKSVTYVGSGIEPVYTNTGIVYWWTFNGTTQEVNIYNGNDTSQGSFNFSGGYMPSLQSGHRKVHCSPDGSKIVIVGENQITIRNNVGSNLYTVTPYDMITDERYYKSNLSAWDDITNSLIVVMDKRGNIEFELDSVFKVSIGSFSSFSVGGNTKQLECYNGFVYSINAETVEPSGFSQSFQRYSEPLSEISTTNNPTTLGKPRKYNSLTRTNISTGVTTNWFTSGLYHTILETSLGRNIYAIYPVSLNTSTCADGHLSVAVATGYNEGGSTFTGPTGGAILKVNNDLTYGRERTIIALSHNYYYYGSTTSDQYKNGWQTSNYGYRFKN